MITGEINADREAEIPLEIKGADGHKTEIKAVINTGFTDYLTLPPSMTSKTTSLRLVFRELSEFVLANGNLAAFESYNATVIWDGAEKSVVVLASEGGPLIWNVSALWLPGDFGCHGWRHCHNRA